MSAIVVWENAVAALMNQRGFSKAQATRELAITNKTLHAQYLAEVNSQPRGGRRQEQRPAVAQPPAMQHPAPVAEQRTEFAQAEYAGDAIAEWNAAVATLMAGGMSKPQATRELVLSNPTLHKAFIAAYDAKWGPVVRTGREKHPAR